MSSRLAIPVEIDGDFDLRVDFTRQSGSQNVEIVFPVAQRACSLTFSGGSSVIDRRSPVHAFSSIYSHVADSNASTRRPGTLVNGQRYRAEVSVRSLGDRIKLEARLGTAAATLRTRASPVERSP